jgi:hypothetical protein
MKFKNIFESSFAIELAKDLAERQKALPPDQIISKLIRFAVIGGVSLLVVIAAVIMIRSALGADPNTRQVLVFASFVSLLVLVSSVGATLVTLWEGFVGQYMQRLALMNVDQEAQEITSEIPVVNLSEQNLEMPAGPSPNVVVAVEDDHFVHNGELSIAVMAKSLAAFKETISPEQWQTHHFDERMEFFHNLNQGVTVEHNLSQMGKNLFATAIPMLSNPAFIAKYGIDIQLATMLSDLEQSVEHEDPDDLPDPIEHVAAG